MIPPKLKDYLMVNGASQTAHSGSKLWDHLSGVHRILKVVKSAEYVCIAGLFHSVYGTQLYKTATVPTSNRSEVKALIGEKAERLVWAFCNLSRPNLFEISLRQKTYDWVAELDTPMDKTQFRDDLIRIECANLLEQKYLHPFPYLAQKAQEMRMLDKEGFSV